MSAPAPSMFSPAAKATAERLGLAMGRANLEEFAATLLALGGDDRDVVVVTSDSRGSGKLGPFGQALPQQLVEVGIAEQNLVGITAGLAAAGKKAFGVSPGCFLSARALEQIKNDVCYSDVPATIVAISAGVSYGALGSTHHSLHDLAALRAIHNITILVPADNFETREAIRAAAAAEHPVYVRFGKAATYNLHPPEKRGHSTFSTREASASRDTTSEKVECPLFSVGTAAMLREGDDVALIASGETVVHALLAAASLAEQGVECRVLSMHTIKPLDAAAVIRAGRECRAVVTVEEHSVHGGLGEACAAVLMQAGVAVPLAIVGIPDEDTVTGSQADIFRHYGITMEGLAATALSLAKQAETCT
jgi:transketolase